MDMGDEDESIIEFFRSRGYEVRIEERDLHSEHIARGEPGRASFFVEGRHYFCVDLIQDGSVVVQDLGQAETASVALGRARRRFER